MFASSPFPRLFEFVATCLRPVDGVQGLQNWQTRRHQHSIKDRSEEGHRQSKPARLTNNISAVSYLQPTAFVAFPVHVILPRHCVSGYGSCFYHVIALFSKTQVGVCVLGAWAAGSVPSVFHPITHLSISSPQCRS